MCRRPDTHSVTNAGLFDTVTRQLQHVLEVEGCAYERLEVSSPGLDRPLKASGDYRRFAGCQVELTLKSPLRGRRKYRGVLQPEGEHWRVTFSDDGSTEHALDFALDEVREGIANTVIRAPYAGIVVARHVQIGETVGVGTPLLTGVSLEHLRVHSGLARKTLRRHRDNLWMLGGDLIRRLHEAPALRKRPLRDTLLELLDDEGRSFLARTPVFVPHARIAENARCIENSRYPMVNSSSGKPSDAHMPHAFAPEANIPVLSAAGRRADHTGDR